MSEKFRGNYQYINNMQISSITSRTSPAVQESDGFAKVKQAFQDLGKALESGNLSDAKEALAQLQKSAPAQASKGDAPLNAKMEALSKAVGSGDLKAAQDAYTDIKKTVSERPAASGGSAGGPPPGGAPPGGAGKSSSAGGSSSSNKVYDKMDANKDGTVSWQEEQDYYQKHPEAVKATSTTANSTTVKINSDKGLIDATA